MAKKTERQAADFIVPLDINGMQGRMLYMPAPRAHADRQIFVVYGHHSNLERWWSLAQNFNKYGAVTMPDLPGFGGMDSLYTIGKKPDLDTMADYLASFMKWRFKRQKVTIVGMSYGFIVITRMLQRYPDMAKKVDMLISAVGFTHYDDFTFSRTRMWIYRHGPKLFISRLGAFIFRHTALQPWILRQAYHRTFNAKNKFEGADADAHTRMMDMEIMLWHDNDVRTHWFTTLSMLTVDNCTKQVPLPVWHIGAGLDQYFDPHRVEQHMRIVFSDFHFMQNKSQRHTPSVIATAKETASFIPSQLAQMFKAKRK